MAAVGSDVVKQHHYPAVWALAHYATEWYICDVFLRNPRWMADDKGKRKRQRPVPSLLNFVELRPFTRRWRELNLDDEGDLAALQLQIMRAPTSAPVIRGTAGLRKMRFAPPSWKTGKSGALRVAHVYFPDFGVVLLAAVYPKNVKADLTAAEKARINAAINRIFVQLEENRRRRRERREGASRNGKNQQSGE